MTQLHEHDELASLDRRYARRIDAIEQRYRRASVTISVAFVVFLALSVAVNWYLFHADHVTIHICCDDWMQMPTPGVGRR